MNVVRINSARISPVDASAPSKWHKMNPAIPIIIPSSRRPLHPMLRTISPNNGYVIVTKSIAPCDLLLVILNEANAQRRIRPTSFAADCSRLTVPG